MAEVAEVTAAEEALVGVVAEVAEAGVVEAEVGVVTAAAEVEVVEGAAVVLVELGVDCEVLVEEVEVEEALVLVARVSLLGFEGVESALLLLPLRVSEPVLEVVPFVSVLD